MRKLTRSQWLASLALTLCGLQVGTTQAETAKPGTVHLVDHHVEGQVITEYSGDPVVVDSESDVTWKQTERGGRQKIYAGPATPHKRAPSPTYVWATGRGSRTFSPGYGFTRIVKYGYEAEPVVYHRLYPQYWYGDSRLVYGPRYPMVYTPTDTTQLGYYYQHVPSWQPLPNMIPKAPWPAHWHNREAPLGHRGEYHGHVYNGQVIYESNSAPVIQQEVNHQPIDNGTVIPAPIEQAPPVETPPVPHVDPQPTPVPDVHPQPTPLPNINPQPTPTPVIPSTPTSPSAE